MQDFYLLIVVLLLLKFYTFSITEYEPILLYSPLCFKLAVELKHFPPAAPLHSTD